MDKISLILYNTNWCAYTKKHCISILENGSKEVLIMQKRKTSDLVQMAMFVAIIILLAFTPIGYIPLGVTRATIIHVPVIIGSIMLGPFAGAFLGAVFGLFFGAGAW